MPRAVPSFPVLVARRFTGWGWIAALFLSGLPLVNFLMNFWEFILSEFVLKAARALRSIFHPFIGWAFGWLPFHIPAIGKDTVMVYLAIGGVFTVQQTHNYYLDRHRANPLASLRSHLVGILLWPGVMLQTLSKPIVAIGGYGILAFPSVKAFEERNKREAASPYGGNPFTFFRHRGAEATSALIVLALSPLAWKLIDLVGPSVGAWLAQLAQQLRI